MLEPWLLKVVLSSYPTYAVLLVYMKVLQVAMQICGCQGPACSINDVRPALRMILIERGSPQSPREALALSSALRRG